MGLSSGEESAPDGENERPIKTQEVVSGSCERQLTEKGRQRRDVEAKRHVRAFMKAYESWKKVAKQARTKLKQFLLKGDLEEINKQIQRGYDHVNQNYEPLQRNALNTADIIQKVDACNTLTTKICDLVSRRLEADQEKASFNPETEKERVRMIFSSDKYGSVFGDTNTASVLNEDLENLSAISKTSSKRADAEAELTAKLEQVKSMQEIQAQQVKLSKLETQWKLHESQMIVQLKQKHSAVDMKLEEEKTRLKLMQAEIDVKVAAARVRTYNQIEGETGERGDPALVGKSTSASNSSTPPDAVNISCSHTRILQLQQPFSRRQLQAHLP